MKRVIFGKNLGKYIPFEEWQRHESEKISYRQRLSANLRVPHSEGNLYDYTFRRPQGEKSEAYDFTQ